MGLAAGVSEAAAQLAGISTFTAALMPRSTAALFLSTMASTGLLEVGVVVLLHVLHGHIQGDDLGQGEEGRLKDAVGAMSVGRSTCTAHLAASMI